jgi:4-amino-4-deoxy-L-arabinose transferase-like glycosyltransferase
MVAALAIVLLAVLDRRPGWLANMKWGWGLLIVALIVGPWAGAVTVATDGGFWSAAVGGDLAPKLAGGQETHGAPPGYHALLAPVLAFPMTLLLPAAAVAAWRRWREPGVRFAIAWLVPAWLVFEAMPTKLVHYTLPAYGALAWLAAAALAQPLGPLVRWLGAILSALVGVLLAAAVFYLVSRYGDHSDLPAAAAAAALLAAAGLAGAWLLARKKRREAVIAAVVCGALGHAALLAVLAPRLSPLWLSARTAAAMERADLLPRQGIADAPVAVAGYAEPSLVFALGTATELTTPEPPGGRGGPGRRRVPRRAAGRRRQRHSRRADHGPGLLERPQDDAEDLRTPRSGPVGRRLTQASFSPCGRRCRPKADGGGVALPSHQSP